jgi:hypothetical protein
VKALRSWILSEHGQDSSQTRCGYWLPLFGAALLILSATSIASAQGFSVTVTVDENGHGILTNTNGFNASLLGTLQPDPGPGGLPVALTYSLLNPPGLTAGDLILNESTVPFSDIFRFNPGEICSDGSTGCLVFYSDSNGVDALADTGSPTGLYANNLNALEAGPEGSNGFTYTPIVGQPGFVAGAGGPVTYVFHSDVSAAASEPATVVLLGSGLAALAGRVAWRNRGKK